MPAPAPAAAAAARHPVVGRTNASARAHLAGAINLFTIRLPSSSVETAGSARESDPSYPAGIPSVHNLHHHGDVIPVNPPSFPLRRPPLFSGSYAANRGPSDAISEDHP